MSNNSETVRYTRNVSINHDYEADKSRWRHIRLAIKPRYLGNHACQMKSYYGTLSGSVGHSFRIRQEKSPETPPSGEITITSYLVGNETSLSRKPCIPDKSYYWTLSGSHGRTFRIRHEKSREAPPGVEITMTSYPACNKSTSLGNHASQIKSYYWSLSGSNGHSFRIHHKKSPEAPSGGEIMMTSYTAGNKTSLYRKPCILDKKSLWNTMRKSRSLFQNPSWKIAWNAPWRRNHDDVISYL